MTRRRKADAGKRIGPIGDTFWGRFMYPETQ